MVKEIPRLSVPIFQAVRPIGELPCSFTFCRYNTGADVVETVRRTVPGGYCTEPERFKSGLCCKGASCFT